MKLAAARAIADVIHEETLSADYIIPSVIDTYVASQVVDAVCEAVVASCVAWIF